VLPRNVKTKHAYSDSISRPVQGAINEVAEEDDDVKRERQRVVGGTGRCSDAMRLVNLTKVTQNGFIGFSMFS
jgi:hypothetical protein